MSDDSPVNYKPVKYVIFDLDGTVLDTESIMITVMSELLEKYGIKYTNDVRLKLIGRKAQDAYDILFEEYNVPFSREVFLREKEEIENKYMSDVEFMPGALDLINWFWEHEIPMAIATSNVRKELEKKIAGHKEIFKKFHHITTSDQVDRGKPYPDIFLLCASKFPLRPTPSEDSIAGVTAACAAGMQVVMVPDKTTPAEQKQKATKTISSLHEFDPKEFFKV